MRARTELAAPDRRRLVACVVATLLAAAGVSFGLTRDPDPTPDQAVKAGDPYRYVERPVGSKDAPPPSGVRLTSPVVDGVNRDGLSLSTAESPPQVNLFLPMGSLGGRGRFGVAITPQAPVLVGRDRRVVGNVYRVRIRSGSGVARLTPAVDLSLFAMRAGEVDPGAAVWFKPVGGDDWRALPSSLLRDDLFGAQFAGPGAYAVVVPTDRSDDLRGVALALLVAAAMVNASLRFATGLRTGARL